MFVFYFPNQGHRVVVDLGNVDAIFTSDVIELHAHHIPLDLNLGIGFPWINAGTESLDAASKRLTLGIVNLGADVDAGTLELQRGEEIDNDRSIQTAGKIGDPVVLQIDESPYQETADTTEENLIHKIYVI